SLILEFVYNGETSVPSEELEQFVNVAEKLEIRGIQSRNLKTQNEEKAAKPHGSYSLLSYKDSTVEESPMPAKRLRMNAELISESSPMPASIKPTAAPFSNLPMEGTGNTSMMTPENIACDFYLMSGTEPMSSTVIENVAKKEIEDGRDVVETFQTYNQCQPREAVGEIDYFEGTGITEFEENVDATRSDPESASVQVPPEISKEVS
ncbi:unnamed protein product, partial [Notodromas monacha]